jgi:hypothetical protein
MVNVTVSDCPGKTLWLILLKNAVHRPPGAEVTLLVKQGSVYLSRRLIDKARSVESFSDNGLLLLA